MSYSEERNPMTEAKASEWIEGLKAIDNGARYCYFVQFDVKDERGNYIPCIAVEGVKGYYRTNWQWGSDFAAARNAAVHKNAEIGIDGAAAAKIQLSTM